MEICKKSYEQGILTYPRSDCEYLPDAHQDEAEKVFYVIEKISSVKVPEIVDKNRKTPVFNSKKKNITILFLPRLVRLQRLLMV
ncbi:MAG: hypothetical protein IJT21_00625 [Synergistaceae bacterium]|nr:hypothetical protein [Synergistaceae bacterium]